MATDDSSTSVPPTATRSTDTGMSAFLTPERLKMLGIGAVAIAVVGGGFWFAKVTGERKESFAAAALEQARNTAEQGDMGKAVQEFERVTSQYAGTGASHEATLGIAQARLVAGQTELAISTLKAYLTGNPPATYASPANGLLGTGLENTGKYAEAEAAYRKAAELATLDFLKATLLLDAARAARLAGRTAEARGIYEEIVAKYSETAARTEAEVRLGELTAAG